MKKMAEEQYGKLTLNTIFTSIWTGDWKKYEEIFRNMNDDLQQNFPFHVHYNREDVQLWYENHFFIPGDYFISPYFSSYTNENKNTEERKKNLLCLIGTYEKLGFYYPLESELYPDHIGCLTAFIGAIQREKIKAIQEENQEFIEKLTELENEIAKKYILPTIESMQKMTETKIQHPFFKDFLSFFFDSMKEEYQIKELS